MLQPPDRYEPLRERFRNFPNLNQGRLPDLIHAGEADIPRLTAGDLGLVPPIYGSTSTSTCLTEITRHGPI